MSLHQFNKVSLTAGAAINGGQVVAYSAGRQAVPAGTASNAIGVALFYSAKDAYASGSQVGVQLKHIPVAVIAAVSIADGDLLYVNASGNVTNVQPGGAAPYGIATEAASAGDIFQAFVL